MNVRVRMLVLASATLVLVAVSGATGATQRHVSLTISITGKGSVRLSDGRRLACSSRCHKTFIARAGTRLGLSARPGSGWVLSAWSGACRGTKATCALRPRSSEVVTITFAPPGSTRANPVRLGQAFTFSDGWVLKVETATIDATAEIVAVPGNIPPPPGAQYTMLNVWAMYAGAGHSSLSGDFAHVLHAEGSHKFRFDPCYQQLPPPQFDPYQDVYSGQTVSGNICFQIASNDADSLMLFSENLKGDSEQTWFALR